MVEAELVDLVATAMPEDEDLQDEIKLELAGLEHLDDQTLWQAAGSRLAARVARRTERLHRKQQREGLTEAEIQDLGELMQQYERAMHIRAQATVLLKRRGHDVSKLTVAR